MSDAPKCEHCKYPFVVDDDLTAHEYWETASREELLETLKFQGATSRLMKDDLVKGFNMGLDKAKEILRSEPPKHEPDGIVNGDTDRGQTIMALLWSLDKAIEAERQKVVKRFIPTEEL